MKFKTIIYVKAAVLKFGKVNCLVQDHTASVNNKGGSDFLSEAQTTPFLPHHAEHRVRTAKGAERKAGVLWTAVRCYGTQHRFLARARQGQKGRKKQDDVVHKQHLSAEESRSP